MNMCCESQRRSFLVDGKGRIVAVHKGFQRGETEEDLRREIEQQLAAKGGRKAK